MGRSATSQSPRVDSRQQIAGKCAICNLQSAIHHLALPIPSHSHLSRSPMPTVITGFARTAIGRFGGGLRPLAAVDLGGVAIAAALERSGVAADQVDEVLLRPRDPGRGRADHLPPGGGARRHPDDGAGHHHQQGVSLRHDRHRPGRQGHPPRRGHLRGRRGDGVDEQRPLPRSPPPAGGPACGRRPMVDSWSTTASGAPSTTASWAIVRPHHTAFSASAAPGAGRMVGREPSPRRRRHRIGPFDA